MAIDIEELKRRLKNVETGEIAIGFCDDALQAIESLQRENAELRAKTAITMGVGDGSAKLFVHGDYESIKACQAIIDENAALRKELEEVRKDAERYRWLCDEATHMGIAKDIDGDLRYIPGPEADEAIDAARKQEPT